MDNDVNMAPIRKMKVDGGNQKLKHRIPNMILSRCRKGKMEILGQGAVYLKLSHTINQ